MQSDYRRGEVVLISFPFSDAIGGEKRPGLVLLDTGDEDLVVARITRHPARSDFDVEIEDWQGAGLLFPSTVRLDKLATLEKKLVERRLGALAQNDGNLVDRVLSILWLPPST